MFFFFLKLKGELVLVYESYAEEILIILIGILNDNYFYLALAGNNDPFRVAPSTSSRLYRYSVSEGPTLTTVFVHLFTINLKFLKTHNY